MSIKPVCLSLVIFVPFLKHLLVVPIDHLFLVFACTSNSFSSSFHLSIFHKGKQLKYPKWSMKRGFIKSYRGFLPPKPTHPSTQEPLIEKIP